MNAELSERDKDIDEQERRIESKNPDTTGCMRGLWQRKFRSTSARERKIMAKFRAGNEKRESRYWAEGEERRCRMCCEESERQLNICGKDVAK
jgi:hypothetical protein